MAQFLGKHTEELVLAARRLSSKKKTEVFYKGAARIKRQIRVHNDGSLEICLQVSFATGVREGIMPDLHIQVQE